MQNIQRIIACRSFKELNLVDLVDREVLKEITMIMEGKVVPNNTPLY